ASRRRGPPPGIPSRGWPRCRGSCSSAWIGCVARRGSVAVDLAKSLVGGPEEVCHLVHDGAPDAFAKLDLVPGRSAERRAEQREAVGEVAEVAATAAGEGNALVQPQEAGLVGRRGR